MPAAATTIVRVSLVAAVAVIAGAAFIRPFEPTRPGIAQGAPLADPTTADGFVLVTAESLRTRIRGGHARGTVVNAWASWCGSCKDDLPLLLGLKKTLGESIDVLFVSVDEAETQPAASKMLLELGAPAPHYVVEGPLGAFKAGMSPHWPGMLPATFLFDGQGTLHYFWGGPVHEDDLVPLLRRYLAGELVDGESNFAQVHGASAP